MNNTNVRGVVVAVILLAGVLWVLQGKKVAADAQAKTQSASLTAVAGSAVTDTKAPFAKQIADDAPIMQFIDGHPSPLAEQVSAALKGDKAVVLVGLPTGKADAQLAGWLRDCTDYCKTMATRIDLTPPGKDDQELLEFLEADKLARPFLVGISPSGEVTKREAGKLERKQVIDVFAEVTGSCGVTCEDGECK